MPTFTTPEPVALVVDIAVRAEIHVVAVAGDQAEVQVRPRKPARALDVGAAEQTRVELVAGRLLVSHRPLRRYSWFSDGGAVDVEVRVPIGSSLDLSSGMGHLRCEGEFGAARLHTELGDIRVDHCGPITARTETGDLAVERVTGDADLRTESGTLRAGEVDGAAHLHNGNGEIVVGVVTGELTAKASNGRILVDRAGGAVTAKSAHGSIAVGRVERGPVALSTANGSIAVGVAGRATAWLDLRTSYGTVSSELEPAAAPERGADVLELRARSSYGDITVRRADPEARRPRTTGAPA